MSPWLRCTALVLAVASCGPTPIPHHVKADPSSTDSPSQEGPTEAGLEAEFSRSRDALRKSPQFQSEDAVTHFRLADTLHHRGDLTGATEEYRHAIRLKPDYVEAYRGLGTLLLDRHDYAGATDALRAAARLRQDDADIFYWLGRSLMAQKDYPGAADALRTVTRLRPDDAEAFADLGLMHMALGDPTEAEAALRHAVELRPDHADVHNRLETVRANYQNPEQVAESARKILDTLFARE